LRTNELGESEASQRNVPWLISKTHSMPSSMYSSEVSRLASGPEGIIPTAVAKIPSVTPGLKLRTTNALTSSTWTALHWRPAANHIGPS
jgi:hypothetical protein